MSQPLAPTGAQFAVNVGGGGIAVVATGVPPVAIGVAVVIVAAGVTIWLWRTASD